MNLGRRFKKTAECAVPDPKKHREDHGKKPEAPEGLMSRCNKCKKSIITAQVKDEWYICPHCGGYFRMPARKRIELLTDEHSFREWDLDLPIHDPLGSKGYQEKIRGLKKRYEIEEAVLTGVCKIEGQETVLAVFDGSFLMGSMGKNVGEKITRAVERATAQQLPIVIAACSGGARMQEGISSLMQMAKTSAALKRHSDAGLLYISILTDPTMGGVTASFAMQGDIILAEPGALIGFAGPRVIEQTIGQKLPKGFQKAEFLLEHGMIDGIVPRLELKKTLEQILRLHGRTVGQNLEAKGLVIQGTQKPPKFSKKDPWDRVLLSRKGDRPVGADYVSRMFEGFLEFHGDRCFGDDSAVMGGIAWFQGRPVTVIVQKKGRTTKENVNCRFGMMSPDGYRKALRLMKQAEKFGRPVISFVDTPGAYCGKDAEERGQGEAIARCLFELSTLQTPWLSIVIGEGGSGGALALAESDEVWMLENSVYSILSPEGYAAILWKDAGQASEAARQMKMTAGELEQAGVVERVFSEPEHFTTETMQPVCDEITKEINVFLKRKTAQSLEELLEQRYQRFRKF